MTLSPTSLEEAAKAAFEVDWERPWETAESYELNYYRGVATAAITTYLAQAEKEGWVMVPREATQEMLDAGTRETEPSPQDDPWYGSIYLSDNQAEQCYRAMLAAAQNGGE